MSDPELELTRLEQERDLYRQLLALGEAEALEPFVAEALALIAKVSRARRGYIELFDERDGPRAEGFSQVHGCLPEEVGSFRASISQGVIASTIATRTTVRSVSAVDDARFRDRSSVRINQIQAVLCAPILAGSYLRSAGCRFQVNRTIGSVNQPGHGERGALLAWLQERGWIDEVGSDLHRATPEGRPYAQVGPTSR